MELKPGMLARSKAGRDKDCIYVIRSVNDEYVYLADGQLRPVCRAKKKNLRHVQPIKKLHSTSVTDDETIRNVIRKYSKSIG